MKIDLTLYTKAEESIKPLYERHKSYRSDRELISEISAVTHIPIIVVAYTLADIKGKMTADIQQVIDTVTKFYGYTEVVGVKNEKE